MTERNFAKKCSKCRERAVELAPIDYATEVHHDGRSYPLTFTDFVVPKCAKCGNFVLDEAASEQITDAFRTMAGLLSPEEIRQQRLALGLTQQELADLLSVAVSTLSRWETGGQIQQRSLDKLMRLCFTSRQVRELLATPDRLLLPKSPSPVDSDAARQLRAAGHVKQALA